MLKPPYPGVTNIQQFLADILLSPSKIFPHQVAYLTTTAVLTPVRPNRLPLSSLAVLRSFAHCQAQPTDAAEDSIVSVSQIVDICC